MNHLTKASNKKLFSIAIFCDLQKAFDTVDHNILFTKLFNIGVRGTELQWFKSYLQNRKQFVTIDGQQSSLLQILLGVPQGSILGPLLFIIYINDLEHYSSLDISLFADDTTLYKSHANLQLLIDNVNFEFQKIVCFFRSHKLSLHPEKTKFILFGPTRNLEIPQIFINFNDLNSPVNLNPIVPMICVNTLEIPVIKYLGVYFDPHLSFKYHVSTISSKISKALYFLRMAKNFLNQKALKYIYYATLHSHLIYAIHIWTATNETTYRSLVLKQKKAVRIICHAKYNAHTEPLFKQQKILPLHLLIEYFKLQFMQRFVQGYLPISFENVWVTNRIQRENEDQITLRNDDCFFIPFARLSNLKYHPLVNFPKTWENFPNGEIKFIRNKNEFNSKLKLHFLEQLSSVITCNRLFCPACAL